jgi:hypothetical protein
MCSETFFSNLECIYPIPSSIFVPEDLCIYCISLFSGKIASMLSEGSSPHHLEGRKKSRCDVDVGEGGSRSRQPQRQYKRIMHRNFSRGDMHIDTEIEEENPMETSDDVSAEDETYRMSPVPPSENSAEDEIESGESGVRHEVEEEEEGLVEGTLNSQSRRRALLHPSPTICSPHKPLSYHVTSYKGKGATKQVKKL